MRITAIIILISIITVIIPIPLSAGGTGSIQLTSTRYNVPADGKSVVTINAQVRDSDGQFVPDGTEIQFTTSLGIIEESATTSSGVARVKLTSPEIEGTAVITATWLDGQAVSKMNLIFGNEDGTESNNWRYITIKSDRYLAYNIDKKVMDALGKVVIKYRNLMIESYSAQIDMLNNRIIARGQGRIDPVKITSGKDTETGEMFVCDISGTRGTLLSADKGGLEDVDFSGSVLTLNKSTASYMPEMFDFVDVSDSPVVVRSFEADVFPGEKIQFKRANIYVNGKKMVNLPYYALSLTGFQVDGDQYIGYSTSGISLNIPLYYSLTPSSSGALLLKHGASTGWGTYGQVPGWFIDVRQNYNTDSSQGSLVFNQVTTKDWGAHYSHSQSFGKTMNGSLFLDYPAHRDLFGSINLNKSYNGFSLGLDIDGSKDQYGGDSFTTGLSIRTKSKKIGKTPFSYNFAGSLQNSRINWDSGDTSLLTKTDTRRINSNITSSPMPIVKNISLRTSLGLGYIWQDSTSEYGDLYGLSTLGSAVLDWKMSKNSNLQLNYRYVDKPAYTRAYKDGQSVVTRPAKQNISANWRIGKPNKWYMTVYGIKGIDYPNLTVFGDLSYRMTENWRLGLRATANKYRTLVLEDGQLTEKDRSYDDLEIILGRKIGNQEISAVWSKSENRIMLELGSGGF